MSNGNGQTSSTIVKYLLVPLGSVMFGLLGAGLLAGINRSYDLAIFEERQTRGIELHKEYLARLSTFEQRLSQAEQEMEKRFAKQAYELEVLREHLKYVTRPATP